MGHIDHRIDELIDGGDWACSFGQGGTLRHVCAQLSQLASEGLADPDLSDLAATVADLATDDPEGAGMAWTELVARLRAELGPRDVLLS